MSPLLVSGSEIESGCNRREILFQRVSDGTFFVSPKKVPQKKAPKADIQPGYFRGAGVRAGATNSISSSVVNSGRIKPGYC